MSAKTLARMRDQLIRELGGADAMSAQQRKPRRGRDHDHRAARPSRSLAPRAADAGRDPHASPPVGGTRPHAAGGRAPARSAGPGTGPAGASGPHPARLYGATRPRAGFRRSAPGDYLLAGVGVRTRSGIVT